METTDRAIKDDRLAASRAAAPRAIGEIQPGGLLLMLSDDWCVEGASENVADFVGCPAADMIGRPASDFLTDDVIHSLRNRLALLRDPAGVERLFGCRLLGTEQGFDVAIQCRGARVMLEAEPAVGKPYGDATGTLRGMLKRLDGAKDCGALLTEATRQLRALTGFDRVTALRFDDDGSATVVAECARGGIGSQLGMHWSDNPVPPEERRHLGRAPLHLHADLDADLVHVVASEGPIGNDLHGAVMRAATPAYADVLRQLGARAALTIALVVDGAAWGVIVCQHPQPRRPAFERRANAELFGLLLSMRLEIFLLRDKLARGDGG